MRNRVRPVQQTDMRSKNSGSWKFNSIVILIIFTFFAIGLYSFRSLPGNTSDSFERYELQQNYLKYTANSESYDLILASDLDKQSKEGNVWKSILQYARLTRDASGQYSVTLLHNVLFLCVSSASNFLISICREL